MNRNEFLKKEFNISQETIEFCDKALFEIKDKFLEIEETSEKNQMKVLAAMQRNKLSESHFSGTTGYGYDDAGRDVTEKVFADVFSSESALVRPQIISGTHALTIALFGNLKSGDELLSAVGKPYDTLESVIGIKKTKGSLIENGIIYKQAEFLPNDQIDYDGIKNMITSRTKLVTIQRSKGYSYRRSLSVEEIGNIVNLVKSMNKDIICMIDNCYGEFTEDIEPGDVCADLTVGSLIKNPGGGLAPVGGYIAGRNEYIENAAIRLTAPGLGKEVGPTLGLTASFMQGLFLAPSVVEASLKGAVFASKVFDSMGYDVLPRPLEKRTDIVQAIKLGKPEKVVAFCKAIQNAAPVDSFVSPEPWAMPGYDCEVIMAAGAFVQGSSIELSADAPMKEPYAVYLQGGLTWEHMKIGVMLGAEAMRQSENL
ncbi:MAG: methionine gamma-lyase family protein [Defluviitaleaceae bacterium]|nr:methionine gamma-lyase family protein [Defluviitaleaceae bacterium]